MARSVTFSGITRFRPGGITRINAEALNQVLASDNSIVGLIGEADGGAPGSVSVVAFDSPDRITDAFRSGPLVDAARFAFQSSSDPDVPGGASRVFCFKTNASTQASVNVPASNGTVEVDSTSTSGSTSTIVDTTLSGTVDDQYNGAWAVVRPFTATAEVRRVDDYDSTSETFTLAAPVLSSAASTDDYQILSDEIVFADAVDDGSSTTTVLTVKQATPWTADEHIGRWVYVQDDATTSYLSKIVDNTANTLTVSPALPATPSQGAWLEILATSFKVQSLDYGAHTNDIEVDIAAGSLAGSRVVTVTFEGDSQVSDQVGGEPVMFLLYKGGAEGTGDTAALGSTASVIQLTTGGLSPSAEVGKQVLINGEYTTIVSNLAGQLTVFPALSEAPGVGDAVSIRTVTGGTVKVEGANGVATSLVTDISGVVGDDLSVSIANGWTLRELAAQVKLNTNYEVEFAANVNPDTFLARNLDFGPDSEASILASAELATEGVTANLQLLVDFINSTSAYISATRATDGASEGGSVPGISSEPFRLSGGARGVSANSDFQAGFDEFEQLRINSVVPLIDQDLVEEGNSSTATWASVAAQLADHVVTMRGAGASERGGFIGFRGAKDEVIAAANSLNDFDVALTCQNPTSVNAAGDLQEFGPRIMAVMAASMRAGAEEVGTPLTFKFLRVSGVTQDSGWNPRDLTDANDMIRAGVLFTETVAGIGTRWVRDLTTWVVNDNLAFSEGSVRDAVRYVAYNVRTLLEERFTGKKATPATVSAIKDATVTILEQMRQENVIVDSTDLATGSAVRAYFNVKVTSSGDVARVSFGIFPVVGINFQLNDIYLQLPTQSA